MGRNVNLYGLETVNHYIENCKTIIDIDVIEGVLLDTLIIYHDVANIIEVFEETPRGCWSSAYVRHIYRKGLPRRFSLALAEQYREA